MFAFLSNIKNDIILCTVALVVGVSGGLYYSHKMHQAKEATVLKKTVKATAKGIVQSHKQSITIERHVALGKKHAAEVNAALGKHFAQQRAEEPKETKSEVPQVARPDDRIDVGTVRLLNDAREGSGPVDATGSSDAASRAPSTVTVEGVVTDDATLAHMYRELATRHDALVDWVESKLREQSK